MVRWCEIHGCFCCKHGNESRITCQWVQGEDIDLPGYISGGWWFLRVVISGGLFATKGCNDLQRLPVATIHLSLSLISCSFRALEETLRASSISALQLPLLLQVFVATWDRHPRWTAKWNQLVCKSPPGGLEIWPEILGPKPLTLLLIFQKIYIHL